MYVTVNVERQDYKFYSYQDLVDFLVQHKLNFSCNNGKLEHSAMLVQRFLQNLKGTLCISAKTFKEVIFGSTETYKVVKDFLNIENNKLLLEV